MALEYWDYWTACDDELPEEDETYLVAWKPKNGVYRGPHFYALMNFENGKWQGKPENSDYWGDFEIIAWMDLPPRFEE